MIKLHERIVVPRTLADCFSYLADFSTIEQWDPGVHRAEKVTQGKPGVGCEFKLILNSAGRRVPMTYQMIEFEHNQRVRLIGDGAGFKADDVIALKAIDANTTEIDYTAEITFTRGAKHIEPALKGWLTRVGKKALAGLENVLNIEAETFKQAERNWRYKLVVPALSQFTQRGYLKMDNKGLTERLDGKRFAITGPTSGLGLASACELSRLGAQLVLIGRDTERLKTARQQVCDFSGADESSIDVMECDLSSVSDATKVGHELVARYSSLDGLINNAGALFAQRELTDEGHERALAVLLLGPYALTQAAMPLLEASKAHVINVASGGMYGQPLCLDDMEFENESYDGAKAYARAKRGLVLLTEHWATAYPSVRFNSMHPGWADTPGVVKSLPKFYSVTKSFLRDQRMGADTIVWLASSSSVNGVSGKFWLDRVVQPINFHQSTMTSDADKQRLIEYLEATISSIDKAA